MTVAEISTRGAARVIIPPLVTSNVSVRIEPFRTVEGVWRAYFQIAVGEQGFSASWAATLNEDGYPNERECVLAHLDRAILYLDELGAAGASNELLDFRTQYARRAAVRSRGTVGRLSPARVPDLGNPSKFAEGPAQASTCQPFSTGAETVITTNGSLKTRGKGQKPMTGSEMIAAGREHLRGKSEPPIEVQEPRKGAAKNSDHAEKIVELPLGCIIRSPTQPREEFDQTAIDQLAESYAKVGVLQAITVRPAPGLQEMPKYELIAGERRWRAAQKAKLITIPSRIVECTDEEALEIQASENLDRENLNPMERANQFQILLQKGGYTQEALAKRFKVSQPEISHAISMLRLPELWQQRVIKRDISQTHARELIPWLDVPKVLEKLADVKADEIGSAADWRGTVINAVHEVSRSMSFSQYPGGGWCNFKPTAKQKEELDIRDVPMQYGRNGKVKRAFNVKLWNELNAAAKKRMSDREKQRRANADATAGPRVDHQAEYRNREFRRHLYTVKRNWLGRSVAEKLELGKHEYLIMKTAIMMPCFADMGCDVLHKAGNHSRDLGSALVEFKQNEFESFVLDTVKAWLTGDVEPYYDDCPEWIEQLARDFKIDISRDWRPTEDYVQVLLEEKDEFNSVIDQYFEKQDVAEADLSFDKVNTQKFIERWPAGVVPEDLLLVDANGDIKRPTKKTPAKAKAKR